MINKYVVGPEKFVLFVDHNSYEPISDKLITNLINDKSSIRRVSDRASSSDMLAFPQTFANQEAKVNIILPPMALLAQQHKLETIMTTLHKIKTSAKTKQLFVWATVKNIHDKKVVPFTEHLADVVVTLLDKKTLTILIRRSSGSVSKKKYQYEVDKLYNIIVREVKGSVDGKPAPAPTIDPESLATFKINVEEEELVARNAMTLPYEKPNDIKKSDGPKIIYHPDSDDDFDEEDPDEDLYI